MPTFQQGASSLPIAAASLTQNKKGKRACEDKKATLVQILEGKAK